MSKSAFLWNMVRKYAAGQEAVCPHCGSPETTVVYRKKLVLQVRKCSRCALMFRYPKDNAQENRSFYQRKYREDLVTDLPDMAAIPHHIAARFADGVGRNLDEHLAQIRGMAPKGRVLDYGCSWGYCVYQFREAGYEAKGFEISQPRVEYGRAALGVDLTSNVDELPDASFDLIYSSHVLEHIPDPGISLRQFQRLLAPGGKVFVFVPNAGCKLARELGVGWGPMIGEKHVIALTAEFFAKNMPDYGLEPLFSSSPYSEAPRMFEEKPDLDGEELLAIGERV